MKLKFILIFVVIALVYGLLPNKVLACGGSYEVCCTSGGSACDSGLSCVGGHCVGGGSCGGAGQACCNGTTCNAGLNCVPGGGCKAPVTFQNLVANPYSQGCTPACGPNDVCTALGCISTSADGAGGFFESIIKVAVGLGGGLALILMLYGVFIVTTSAGIPDKLKEGSEIITSTIAGLIFILLSVFLLNLIGINILGLPGLT